MSLTVDATNRNRIRHMRVGKVAKQAKALSYTEPSV